MQRGKKRANKKRKTEAGLARPDVCNRSAIGIIGISEEGEGGVEEISEGIVAENFLILRAERKPQIQEPWRTSSKIDTE